jgi:hypothetical protein
VFPPMVAFMASEGIIGNSLSNSGVR